MKTSVKRLWLSGVIVSFAASLMGALPATAQSNEQTYGSVRGWTIGAAYENAVFAYCTAAQTQRGRSIKLGFSGTQWAVGVQTSMIGEFSGVVEIDRRGYQSTFRHQPDGWASAILAYSQVEELKNGSTIGINSGHGFVDFSLSGSAAAMLKMQECYSNAGRPPLKQASKPTLRRPTQNAPTLRQPTVRQPSVRQPSVRQPTRRTQTAQNSQGFQPPQNASRQRECRGGEGRLPETGLCLNTASKYLDVKDGVADTPPPGCDWAVNETRLAEGYVLYNAIRCNGATAKLEYGSGAHFASLSVSVSTYSGQRQDYNGDGPELVTIGLVENNDVMTSIWHHAQSGMENPADARDCYVYPRGSRGDYPDGYYTVDISRSARQQLERQPDYMTPVFECGRFSDGDVTSFWRAMGDQLWFFDFGQDVAQFDHRTFTRIIKDANGEWSAVE